MLRVWPERRYGISDAKKRNRDLKHDVGLNLSVPEDSIALITIEDGLVVEGHLIRVCLLKSACV